MQDIQRQTLSVREAATMLGVSRSFLYDLIAKGEVRSITLGTRTLLSREYVEGVIRGDNPQPASGYNPTPHVLRR